MNTPVQTENSLIAENKRLRERLSTFNEVDMDQSLAEIAELKAQLQSCMDTRIFFEQKLISAHIVLTSIAEQIKVLNGIMKI